MERRINQSINRRVKTKHISDVYIEMNEMKFNSI